MVQDTATYFNRQAYATIENKVFIPCNAATAYDIARKAQRQGVVCTAKYDGIYSNVVVDGIKDKEFVDAVKKEFHVHTEDDPTFFNSSAFNSIENKAFIMCDSVTAYEIGQAAQEQGINFAAKYDTNNSAIVVDGIKDNDFVKDVGIDYGVYPSDSPEFINKVTAQFSDYLAEKPSYYNRKAYSEIENKTFLPCNVKTAYNIGQMAKREGILFSIKYDGNRSSVVVDGEKNKEFVEAMKERFKLRLAGDPTFFNSRGYNDISSATFLVCNTKEAYAIGQMAEEQSIPYAIKYDGENSVVALDSVKAEDFINDAVYEYGAREESDPANIESLSSEFGKNAAAEPVFYNKSDYSAIENKEFLNTDAKTAETIADRAQEQNVVFSAKIDGNKATVTVDGVKNKAFVDTIKAEFADKLAMIVKNTEAVTAAVQAHRQDRVGPAVGVAK